MPELHVYENHVDSVVAESAEHAEQLMTELIGEPYTDGDCGEFRQLPDAQLKSIAFDDEDEAKTYGPIEKKDRGFWVVRQTCAEWAKCGPAQIGSTEY